MGLQNSTIDPHKTQMKNIRNIHLDKKNKTWITS